MSTHNIPFQYIKENHPNFFRICSPGIFSKGLKNEFETARVNEPSGFEPLKFYCKYLCADGNKRRSLTVAYAHDTKHVVNVKNDI